MDLLPQSQQQQQQQQQQHRGSPSSMPKLAQPPPTKSEIESTHSPPRAASRPHFSLYDDSNNVNDSFKTDAGAATSGTVTHPSESRTQEEDPNVKTAVAGETDATTGGGVSNDYNNSVGAGASAAPSLLGTRADPFMTLERWPGCVNNNEYTIEAAGDKVLQSGAGATAQSSSQRASTVPARRTGPGATEAATPAEASSVHCGPRSFGGGANKGFPAACTGSTLGGVPMAVDVACLLYTSPSPRDS